MTVPKLLGMSYTVEGSGRDVLLLHGWGSNKESFVCLKNHLKRNFRVTAVDFYGFGESDMPKMPMSVFDYATRLECFLELVKIRPYAIVAHSFGARVAIKLLSLGFGCDKLVITGGAGIRPKRSVKYIVKTTTYKLLKKLKIFNTEKLRRRFSSKDYNALDENMRQTFVKVVSEDLTDSLSDIRADTLLIWGKDDRETPLYMAKIMERKIPSSAVVVMENAGHFAFIDKPFAFNKIVNTFLLSKQQTN